MCFLVHFLVLGSKKLSPHRRSIIFSSATPNCTRNNHHPSKEANSRKAKIHQCPELSVDVFMNPACGLNTKRYQGCWQPTFLAYSLANTVRVKAQP